MADIKKTITGDLATTDDGDLALSDIEVPRVDLGDGISTAVQPPHVDEARDYRGDDKHEHDKLADQTVAQRTLHLLINLGSTELSPRPDWDGKFVTGTSPHLFTDKITVAVEETTPSLVVKANCHLRLARIFGILDPSVDTARPLCPLKVSGADAKLISEFVGIDDPITQMSHGEPHGDALLQLGNTRGAEAEISTARGNSRGDRSASRQCAAVDGRSVRVPRFFGGIRRVAGPPEPDTSAGSDGSKLHHN